MIKKLLAFAITGVMALSVLTACTKKAENNTDTAKTDSNDKVQIRLLTRMAGESKQVQIYKGIIDEFKAKHPEVEIIDDSQGDEGAFNNILSTDIASGKMANIFRIQGVANLSKYIDNGLILNVEPLLKADPEWGSGFTEGALAYYKVPGKDGVYAIPMESGLIGVYYNEALFKAAGVDKFPETWDDFLGTIKKLRDSGVTPIALGEQTTYMGGHLHDQIFYKYLGTDAAKLLGNRQKKWTDPDVVQTLQFIKDLIDAQAFDPDAAGLSDDVVMTQFRQGQVAMVITGPWNIAKFSDEAETPVAKDIKLAKFPYFKDKPEFKDDDMQVLSPYMISGKLEGKELELTVELVKMLTSKEATKKFAEESGFLIPRKDVELDSSKVSFLFSESVKLGATSKGIGVDIFDFDPVTSMQDRTRNSILSIFLGSTPEEAAKEIQAEIDAN